jgi:ubiquinone/menaquinone biosynthesis C-methylase UbiE
MAATDTLFAGSIPGCFDCYLGPLLFEPYAEEVARRARIFMPGHILETAAGTGIVTDALHHALSDAEIIATDLNPAMLEIAAGRVQTDKVTFEPADAQDLRFADESFDLVVCQFGAMFYPDKVKAAREAYRVLRDGGHYLMLVWDRLDRNPVSQIVHDAVARLYPGDPPSFLARLPFGYSDRQRIEKDLRSAGFRDIEVETVELKSEAVSSEDAAIGLVAGCPLRSEIEERDPNGVDAAIAAAAEALRPLETDDGLDSRLSAHLVTATK